MFCHIFKTLFIIVFVSLSVSGEVHSSLEDIIDLRQEVIQADLPKYVMKTFIEPETKTLHLYKRLQSEFEAVNEFCAENGGDKSVAHVHPVMMYKTLWKVRTYQETMSELLNKPENRNTFNEEEFLQVTERFPTEEDFKYSATAVQRLQDWYKLPLSDVISGKIYARTSRPLTMEEIWDIIRHANATEVSEMQSYNRTLSWLLELHKMIPKRMHQYNELRLKVLFAMARVLRSARCDCSVEFSEFVEDFKTYSNSSAVMRFDAMRQECDRNYTMDRCRFLDESAFLNPVMEQHLKLKALCRGENVEPHEKYAQYKTPNKELFCYLQHNNHPLLMYSPIKVEVLNKHSPYIAIHHGVLKDNEIDFIKNQARPALKRGTTLTKNGQNVSPNKISKTTVLKLTIADPSAQVIKSFRTRTIAKSGLNKIGFENLQVANYGLGGLYNIHVDFPLPPKKPGFTDKEDCRLFTSVHYMSDVEYGGQTVFPHLGISSPAKKGNALVFVNLFRNGTGNQATRHVSCPVLYGNKWITTQWVTRYHQEFHFPCSLDRWE